MKRVLKRVTECRSVLRALERPGDPGESSSAEAERVLYFTLMSAIDAGLNNRPDHAYPARSPTPPPKGRPRRAAPRDV
jgi:hypothetical protein